MYNVLEKENRDNDIYKSEHLGYINDPDYQLVADHSGESIEKRNSKEEIEFESPSLRRRTDEEKYSPSIRKKTDRDETVKDNRSVSYVNTKNDEHYSRDDFKYKAQKSICGGIFMLEDGNITVQPNAYDFTVRSSPDNTPTKSKNLIKSPLIHNVEGITGIDANFETITYDYFYNITTKHKKQNSEGFELNLDTVRNDATTTNRNH